MVSSVFKQAAEMLRRRKKNRRWLAVFLCLAVVAVLGTIMVLKPTGRAMTREERVLACKHVIHQHTNDCYVEGENGKELTCGYADFVIHQHAESCYDAAGNLVCTLPEVEAHVHEAGCFEEERTLVCGQLEGEGGHEHTEACYGEPERVLICGQEEGEEHTHSEECYQTGEAPLICGMETGEGGHVHTEACMEVNQKQICTKPEVIPHIHDDTCYTTDDNGNKLLTCGLLQVEEHIHRDDCFETIEVAVEDTELPGESVSEPESAEATGSETEAESASEAETAETSETSETSETESTEAVTESPVYICGLEEHIHEEACYNENGELSCDLTEHTHDESCVKPEEEKEYICGFTEHVHSTECYDGNGELICGLEEHTHDESCVKPEEKEYICGLTEHIHSTECYGENGELVCGLTEHTHDESCLAETEAAVLTQTWRNEKYAITASYTAAAELPENALLQVEEITEESDPEKYAKREAEARELLDEALGMRCLFKIGFYVDGEEVEPKDKVSMTIQFLDENGYAEGEPVKIIHYTEEKTEILEAGEVDSEGVTGFDAESFSEFGIPEIMSVDGDVEVGNEEQLKTALSQKTGGKVTLTANLTFEDSNLPQAIRLQMNAGLELDLNGHVITVKSAKSLIDVRDNAALTIIDSAPAKDEVVPSPNPDYLAFGWKGVGGYQNGSLTYYEIVSEPNEQGTSETLVEHKVTGGGAIIRESADTADSLIFVKTGAFTMEGGMLNGGGHSRAVTSTGQERNSLNLYGGYICNCAISMPDGDVARNYNGGALVDASGAVINLGGQSAEQTGTVIANNQVVYSGTTENQGSGGGIAMTRGGTLNIYGGIVTGNQSSKYGKGGGIYTSGGVTVNMSGGNICNNRDDHRDAGNAQNGNDYTDRINEYGQYDGGGGILIGGNGTLKMTGGQITGNSGAGGGGIQTTKDGSELYISGGIIARNLAELHEGGGLVTVGSGGYAQIIAGTGTVYITNNKTATTHDWGGGGMFCVESAHLIIQSAIITDNIAEGFGGGVGGCSNAQIYENLGPLTLDNGTAVYGNTAAGTGVTDCYYHTTSFDDARYASVKEKDAEFTQKDSNGKGYYQDYYCEQYSTVKNQMLGGGTSDWVGSFNDKADDGNQNDSIHIDFKQEGIDEKSASNRMGLNSYPTAEAVKNAASRASVYITGNYSVTHGGGVQCNGLLVLGDYNGTSFGDSLQIQATKELLGADGKEASLAGRKFAFEIYRYIGGTETLVRTVENGEQGEIDFGALSVSGSKSDGVSTVQYLIREKLDEGDAGILGDSTEYLVTIPVAGETQTQTIGSKTYTKRRYWILNKEQYKGSGETYSVTVQSRSSKEEEWGEPQIRELTAGTSGAKILALTTGNAASFINKEIRRTNIAVQKMWSEESATQTALSTVKFVTVTLYRSSDNGQTWEEQETVELQAPDWKYDGWKNLVVQDSRTPNTVYSYDVKETKITFTDGTEQIFDGNNRTESFRSEKTISSTDPDTETTTFTFTNTHVDDLTYGLRLYKAAGDVNGTETDTYLAGAEFQLFLKGSAEALKLTGSDGVYKYVKTPGEGESVTTLVTGSDGYITIHDLPVGEYQFVETKAPLGYVIAENIPVVSVNAANATGVAVGQDGSQKIEAIEIKVVDPLYYYEIPETGGMGTGHYMTLGGMLFLLAAGIGVFCLGKKRSRKENS